MLCFIWVLFFSQERTNCVLFFARSRFCILVLVFFILLFFACLLALTIRWQITIELSPKGRESFVITIIASEPCNFVCAFPGPRACSLLFAAVILLYWPTAIAVKGIKLVLDLVLLPRNNNNNATTKERARVTILAICVQKSRLSRRNNRDAFFILASLFCNRKAGLFGFVVFFFLVHKMLWFFQDSSQEYKVSFCFSHFLRGKINSYPGRERD